MRIHRIIARLGTGGPAMHVVHLARGMNHDRFQTRLMTCEAGVPVEPAGPPKPPPPGGAASAREAGGSGETSGTDEAAAPGGATAPGEAAVPGEVVFPGGPRSPEEVAFPGEAAVPGEAAFPGETALPGGPPSPGEVARGGDDMTDYARERGVTVHPGHPVVDRASPSDRRPPAPGAFRLLLSFYLRFRRERPDIVHTHGGGAVALARIAAILARVPVRIHTVHGECATPRRVDRLLARLTHRIVVLAEAHRERLAEQLDNVPDVRFRTILPGLELERFTDIPLVHGDSDPSLIARAMLGVDDDTWIAGIVGGLTPEKNHELLFDAVASLEDDDIRVLVVGGGERESVLKAYAAGAGIADRVTWLGWRRDLCDIYPAMDVLALPSGDEATSTVLVEALAAGTPVVARAVGGVPAVLDFGSLGQLVTEEAGEDPARAFAAALTEALEDPPTVERRAEARRAVTARYEIGRLLRETEDLYREVLAEAGGVV